VDEARDERRHVVEIEAAARAWFDDAELAPLYRGPRLTRAWGLMMRAPKLLSNDAKKFLHEGRKRERRRRVINVAIGSFIGLSILIVGVGYVRGLKIEADLLRANEAAQNEKVERLEEKDNLAKQIDELEKKIDDLEKQRDGAKGDPLKKEALQKEIDALLVEAKDKAAGMRARAVKTNAIGIELDTPAPPSNAAQISTNIEATPGIASAATPAEAPRKKPRIKLER
jgi:cell division protein FtsB